MKIKFRDPKKLMTLTKLGSFHQSRLSFLRSFLNEFKDWKFKKQMFNLDKDGYGIVVYSLTKKNRSYSLICFANKIKDTERSDRVIATKWDAAFTLFDGIPKKSDLNRLLLNVPKQEVGRVSYKELTLSRANKSIRIFNYVVEQLSRGLQPEKEKLKKVGYLYRTTAVYGSGKFGLADRFRIKNRKEICGPFRLEMMLVYLVRQFTFDQVNHIAKNKNPKKAIALSNDIKRNLGIGNSTGLGMAPFIINHPTLLNNWILARETALKKIREKKIIKLKDFNKFYGSLKKSLKNIDDWLTASSYQRKKIKNLKSDIKKFVFYVENGLKLNTKHLFNKIFIWCDKNLTNEGIEYIVSLMLEPYPEIANNLVSKMSSDEERYFNIPSHRNVGDLKNIIEKNYGNIIKLNFKNKRNNHNFWFISKNKEEPRLANRYSQNGSDLEQPIAIGRDIKLLYDKVLKENKNRKVGLFLLHNNNLRHVVRRVFIIEKFPYSEIQDNTIGSNLIPIDMLRLKLSFFGAVKFDPKSDKWLRICMFQGAPLVEEMDSFDDQWIYSSTA